MDVENMLEAEDKLNSAIKLEGNYFIMDSEQLVSNPFQELSQDAAGDAQKKSTMTERLTSVKNNVCENHFLMAKSRLERQKLGRLKQLHDNSNKLRHEVKLLDLDRQRHQVEVKKRVQPERDFSYDDTQITNTERRLGANIASFYLEKKLKYPTRLRSVSDISLTPTVRRARNSLRQQDLQRAMDQEVTSLSLIGRCERVNTAKTVSTAYTAPSITATRKRRGSRSAPLYATRNSAAAGARRGDDANTLPDIQQAKLMARPSSHHEKQQHNTEGKPKTAPQTQPPHVKFAFENPLKILASSEESAKLFARSYTYYPGLTRAVNCPFSDSSDDDDDPVEVIDLRALLFNKGQGDGDGDDLVSTVPSQHSLSHHHLLALRKAQGPPPKLTTDMMQVENDYINTKINRFLEDLAMPRRRRAGSDSSDDDDNVNDIRLPAPSAMYKSEVKATTSMGTNTNTGDSSGAKTTVNPFTTTKSTSTTDLYGQNTSSNNLDTTNSFNVNDNNNNNININNNNNKDNTAKNGDTKNSLTSVKEDDPSSAVDTPPQPKHGGGTPRKAKYSWQYIRGRPADGQLKGTYKSEDLVLQALTGVPLSNALNTHVPLHSASRAMRHTATFKMHKVVERLIHERTKYEQHQVEELKRQMSVRSGGGGGGGKEEGGSHSHPSTPPTSHPSRRVSVMTMRTS